MYVLLLFDVVYVPAFVFVGGCFMHGHPVNNLLLDMKTSVFQNAPAAFCSTRYILYIHLKQITENNPLLYFCTLLYTHYNFAHA